MKRHASLHPLSQHHHFALIQALFIRRASSEPSAKRASAMKRIAGKFLCFWEGAGKQHFREEEEVLLPAYARHKPLDKDADVVRMLAQHAEIRARIADLTELLESGEPLEEELTALGKLLQEHVRLEEDKIFPRIEKTLSDADLQKMGRGLTRLHRKNDTCEF